MLLFFMKEDDYVPLSMADIGKKYVIRRIRGKDEVVRFIENLGFVAGAEVIVVAQMHGNIIVNVKGSRVAVGRDMAGKIIVE